MSGAPDYLTVLLQILALEGHSKPSRIPGVYVPRDLFPDPFLYIYALSSLRRQGSITYARVDWLKLVAEWFSPAPWRHPPLWRPTITSTTPRTSMSIEFALARAMYPRLQISEAAAALGRALTRFGFPAQWIRDAGAALRFGARNQSIATLQAAIEVAARDLACHFLESASNPYELRDHLLHSLSSRTDQLPGRTTSRVPQAPTELAQVVAHGLATRGIAYDTTTRTELSRIEAAAAALSASLRDSYASSSLRNPAWTAST